MVGSKKIAAQRITEKILNVFIVAPFEKKITRNIIFCCLEPVSYSCVFPHVNTILTNDFRAFGFRITSRGTCG